MINEYNIKGEVCRVSIIWKDWEADLNYSKMVEPVLRTQIVVEAKEKTLSIIESVTKQLNTYHQVMPMEYLIRLQQV